MKPARVLLLGGAIGLASLSVPLSGAPTTVEAPHAPAVSSSLISDSTGDPIETILLYSDHAPVRIRIDDSRALSGLAHDDLVAAWLWSRVVPPRRVAPDRLIEELARFRREEASVGGRPLRIQLPDRVDDAEVDLKVLAGPAALFEEVPEEWIPRWTLSSAGIVEVPRTPGTPWRIRLVGQGRGSAWRDVGDREAQVVLAPVAAIDVLATIMDAEGRPLPQAQLVVAEAAHGTPRPTVWSRALASERGEVRVASLPADVLTTLIVSSPSHAPRVLAGRSADFPSVVRLPAAASLGGHFIDDEGEAAHGVGIRAEGWLARDLPFTFTRTTESGENGSWEVTALPPGRLVLQASRNGYVPLRLTLELDEGESRDLGETLLVRGADLPVVVRDDLGEGIASATIRAISGPSSAISDAHGKAVLRDLLPEAVLELRVEAPGFLPRQIEILPPWPSEVTLQLTRPLTVSGRFVGTDGLPVVAGTVRIERGDTFRFEELEDGGFELRLEPGVVHTLRLSSPVTARHTLEVQPGLPGERRDLGEIAAPPGLVVTGILLSELDGSPVTGARVWLPRPSPDPLGAWFLGDVLETGSDELGRFVLGGLEPKPDLLRIDASGFARRHVEVLPEVDVPELDLGTIELTDGVMLQVHVPQAKEETSQPAVARVDLRGEWSDFDMLTAPVADGVARLQHVPAGPALLTVLAGRELVCEKYLEVSSDHDSVEVLCAREGRPVSGAVRAAGRPAGHGTLVWRSSEQTAVKATIMNRESRLGLHQQQVVGRGRPPVRVEVADDGTFVTEDLTPGSWNVTWWPAGGSPASPRRIQVPRGSAPHVIVDLPGGFVEGHVVDEGGRPVEGARVRELNSQGSVLTGLSGDFRIHGLQPATARLQAQYRELFSEVVEVPLGDGSVPDPIDLVLSSEHLGRLSVQVWSEAGLPASGAFVFFDLDEQGLQVVSADGAGRANVSLSAPYPRRARLAALHRGHWVFGDWISWERFRRGIEEQIPASGELLLASEEELHPAPSLGAPHGWDLSLLLSILGPPPRISPDRPLLLSGLPEGVYRISGDRAVNVRAGRRERLEIEKPGWKAPRPP